MRKIFALLFLITLLPACTWSIPKRTVTPIKTTEHVIDKSKSFYLAIGSDGQEQSAWNREDYHRVFESGRSVSNQIYNFLKVRGYNVSMASSFENEKDALKSAKAQGYDYMIFPRTNFWIDPVYMICGNYSRNAKYYNDDTMIWHDYDEADVDILLFDAQSGKLVSNYNLRAIGCPVVVAGLIPLGRTSPEGHLKDVLDEWEGVQIKQESETE